MRIPLCARPICHFGVQLVYSDFWTWLTAQCRPTSRGFQRMQRLDINQKLELIGGIDPFSSPLGEPVESCDLVVYLVLQTSFLTTKQFKARKSLEAYNQFVCGWIKEVKVWDIANYGKYLVKGRVSILFYICKNLFYVMWFIYR